MRSAGYVFGIVLSAILLAGSASAWDVFYDGSVMPNDSVLGTNVWSVYGGGNLDLSHSSTDGDALHLADWRTDGVVYFNRFAAPRHSPITLQAKVRVSAGDGLY